MVDFCLEEFEKGTGDFCLIIPAFDFERVFIERQNFSKRSKNLTNLKFFHPWNSVESRVGKNGKIC